MPVRDAVFRMRNLLICVVSIGSQQADRRRVQGKVLALYQCQSNPACRKSRAELAVREQRNDARHGGQPCD